MTGTAAFLPAILGGILFAHLVWTERTFWNLALKLFLGVGFGMGLRSLLYFLYLLVLPGQDMYALIELGFLLLLVALTIRAERRAGRSAWSTFTLPRTEVVQRVALVASALVVGVSMLSTANYLLRRRQGDWDAWMMYNRAARFLYVDQANWRSSFSPLMDPIFHADYPLLLAADIVAGWDTAGQDSAAVPMLQSALFSIACLGLFCAALASSKSIGQAAFGAIILWGLPVFVNEGARQMADVPMAFFILAVGVLIHKYVQRPHAGLLVLAGLSAGLGAWTKNEGAVLVVGAVTAVVVFLAPRYSWRAARDFAIGLALPLIVVLFFKMFLAPSGDIVGGATSGLAAKFTDPSRHAIIIQFFWSELKGFGTWGVPGLAFGILPLLGLHYVLFRASLAPEVRLALAAGFTVLGIQLFGYYAAYLISPYELEWHLAYSSTRVVLQLFPLLAFLALSSTVSLENALGYSPARTLD